MPRPHGEAPDPHCCIARRDQAVGQSMRRRDRAGKHVRFPSRTPKVGIIHPQRPAVVFIQRIDDRLDIDLIGTEGERLHWPAQGLRFAYGRHRRERSIERRDAAPVETPTMTARALPGQGGPGPLRIVCPVNQAAEPHHQSTDSGVAAGHDAFEIGVHVVGPAFA